MPQVFTRKNEISDVLKWEVDNRFSRDQMTVDNTAGATDLEFKVGECYVKDTVTKLTGSEAAVPAAWTVVIGGTWAAADTLVIGTTTFTFVASGADASNDELNVGTGAEIIAQIQAINPTVTGYTVAYEGSSIVFTQATASSTETPPTVTPTSTAGTATSTKTTSYKAAVVGNESDIDFIVLENKTVYAGQTMTVLGLMRGPAIVDISNVICTDQDAMKAQLLTKNIITIYPGPYAVYQET